jgi:hypothetical protein
MRVVQTVAAVTLLAGLVTASACARERGEEPQVPPRRFNFRLPRTAPSPTQTQGYPPGTATAPVATTTAPTSTAPTGTGTATAAPTGTVPPPISSTDLIKFQDACWKNCDQFACMKIAEAYRTGSGLPQDVLAGRRYAVHACQECGAPSVAVEPYCPNWNLDKK